jgi:hypothetical protein
MELTKQASFAETRIKSVNHNRVGDIRVDNGG